MNKNRLRAKERLEQSLSHYPKYNSWKNGMSCILNEKEIKIIDSYRSTGNHKVIADLMNQRVDAIRRIYFSAITKLNTPHNIRLYKKWDLIGQLEEAGLLKMKESHFNSTEPVCYFTISKEDFIKSLSKKGIQLDESFLPILDDFQFSSKKSKKKVLENSLQIQLLVEL